MDKCDVPNMLSCKGKVFFRIIMFCFSYVCWVVSRVTKTTRGVSYPVKVN